MKKTWLYRIASVASSFAIALAIGGVGINCRTWLYQPKVPAKLRDM